MTNYGTGYDDGTEREIYMSQPRPRAPHANRTRTAHAIIERSREGETPTPPTRPTARPGEEARLTSRIRYIPSKYGPPPKARWKDTPRYWTNGRHHVRGAHPHSRTHHTPPARGRTCIMSGWVGSRWSATEHTGGRARATPQAPPRGSRMNVWTTLDVGPAGHGGTVTGEHC